MSLGQCTALVTSDDEDSRNIIHNLFYGLSPTDSYHKSVLTLTSAGTKIIAKCLHSTRSHCYNTDPIIQLPSPYYGLCKDRGAPTFGPATSDS